MNKPDEKYLALRNLISYLSRTETANREYIQKLQYQQLRSLINHVALHSAYFKRKLSDASLTVEDITTPGGFKDLPVMTRRDIQSAGSSLFCSTLPDNCLPTFETQTSGSTGEPIKVIKSHLNKLFWLAYTFRDHYWWKRDANCSLAIIRAFVKKAAYSDWTSPINLLHKTGPSFVLPINTDVNEQIDWLCEHNPDYLLTYPTNLQEIILGLKENNISLPSIKQVRLVGEPVNPELREMTKSYLNSDISDAYSSQDAGYIALQCPDCHQYHVMAEGLIVEILDDKDNQCLPGETGRVIVTDLFNYATPIIRYELGDYAEVGISCSHRQGLPSLNRIKGRERNMLITPNGKRYWPIVGFRKYRDIADIKQFQMIQKEKGLVHLKLVVDSALTRQQEEQLTKLNQSALGYPFQITFEYFQGKLPMSENGKFEEFVCEIS